MALVNSFDGIIFDYGGVLVHHQSAEDQARMAEIAGIPASEFTELYWRERADYDKGSVSGQEYWSRIAEFSGKTFPAEVIEQLTELDNTSWMHFDSVIWEWLDQLRTSGKRVAILSNMPLDLGEALKLGTDRFTGFDQVTLSYEVRSVKPEPAIYEHCLEGLGTTPDRTLFLDDRIENIQGAEMLGIHAIQFTSRDEVLLKIRS